MAKIQTLRTIVTQAVIIAAVLIVPFIITTGAKYTPDTSVQTGNFLLSTTDYGVALYQPGGNWRYYPITIPEDIVATKNGSMISLTGKTVNDNLYGIIDRITGNIATLFRFPVSKTLKNDWGSIRFEPEITGQQISIKRTVSGIPDFPEWTTMTIVYNRDDFVIDANGVVYTENTYDDISMLSTLAGKSLVIHDSAIRMVLTEAPMITIVNPALAGAIRVSALPGQTISIDKNNKHIVLIQTPVTLSADVFVDEINLQVINDFRSI